MTPSEFINWIYKDVPPELSDSCVSLWNKQTKDSLHLAIPTTPQGCQVLDQACEDQVGLNQDVYFGVALRRPNLLPKQRGKIQDCRALPGLFLDIDIDTAASPHAAKNLPKTDADCISILEVLPEPTGIINSGHGWHAYWLFETAHVISYTDYAPFSNASEQFQRRAIAHAQSLGYHLDFTANLDRILRLPGTINTKAGLFTPVSPIYTDGPRYGSLNALLDATGIDLRVLQPASSIQPTNPQDIDASLLQADATRAKAQTTDWTRDALSKLHNPESKELFESILKGKSFAPAGARDQTLQRIASILAYVAPDRDPMELAREILGPSLESFAPDDVGKYTQEDRITWAAEKIARAQEDARRDRVVEDRHNQSLADVLLKQARSAPRRDQRLGPAPAGAYTDAEIGAFSAQQHCAPADFNKRWIIQKGANFYVYVNGDYQKPLDQNEFENSIYRDLSPAIANGFVQLDTLTVKGEPRRKTPKEIMRDYCSVSRTLIARIDLGYSYYDESTQTFYEATCPVRPLTPLKNDDIDMWLRLLGNAKAQLLINWVASVTKLDKQCAALYLEGPPGTGKTLLSKGLAKLWQQRGGATELIRVLGEWTTDLARCPLIVADEQIPQSFKGQRSSAELRSLIGSDSRTLTRKFAHNADLVGAVRLILSANNADMLVFEESLSQSDLEAVAGRFLHISGDKASCAYLESVDTAGWVDDDLIARHALWLRDNTTFISGKRFIVEGSAREVSKQLATRGGVAGRVCEWLVRYLCETPTSSLAAKQSSPQQKDVVRVGNGRYLVNTNAVVLFWEQHAKSKVVPSTPQVGLALRNLSTKQVRAGSKRFFEIDIEAISSWAESNLIGDAELIQEKISQVLEEAPGDVAC